MAGKSQEDMLSLENILHFHYTFTIMSIISPPFHLHFTTMSPHSSHFHYRWATFMFFRSLLILSFLSEFVVKNYKIMCICLYQTNGLRLLTCVG